MSSVQSPSPILGEASPNPCVADPWPEKGPSRKKHGYENLMAIIWSKQGSLVIEQRTLAIKRRLLAIGRGFTTAARVALAIRDIACVTKHVALAIGQLLWVRNK